MSDQDDLFGGLAEGEKEAAKPAGAPRLREPVRDQVGLRVVDLDALIGTSHAAHEDHLGSSTDLRELEGAVKAREHTAGQAPVQPASVDCTVAVDQRRDRKRACAGAAVREP